MICPEPEEIVRQVLQRLKVAYNDQDVAELAAKGAPADGSHAFIDRLEDGLWRFVKKAKRAAR